MRHSPLLTLNSLTHSLTQSLAYLVLELFALRVTMSTISVTHQRRSRRKSPKPMPRIRVDMLLYLPLLLFSSGRCLHAPLTVAMALATCHPFQVVAGALFTAQSTIALSLDFTSGTLSNYSLHMMTLLINSLPPVTHASTESHLRHRGNIILR